MTDFFLHHISLTTKDLSKAIEFYTNVLGFTQITRPAFPLAGAWLQLGAVEIHLIDYTQGTFRKNKSVCTDDIHFAVRTRDFQAIIGKLNLNGYREDLIETDNNRIIVKHKSLAGYSQLYISDPDGHVIEINAAY